MYIFIEEKLKPAWINTKIKKAASRFIPHSKVGKENLMLWDSLSYSSEHNDVLSRHNDIELKSLI